MWRLIFGDLENRQKTHCPFREASAAGRPTGVGSRLFADFSELSYTLSVEQPLIKPHNGVREN
jgi:hypothetical protein